jgi:predicted dehydrogenase
MTRPVGIGVIGCGAIASWVHLRVLPKLAGARLLAAADPDPAARARAHKLTGVPVLAETAELLAHPDLQAVVICAPTHLHAPLAIAAARARKAIYVEKPLAQHRDEARQLAGAVRDAGVLLATGYNGRYHPLCRQAKELLSSGRLGAIRHVFTTFCEPLAGPSMPAWKRTRATGGGALLDLGSHHVDFLRWVLGGEPAVESARIRSVATEDDDVRFTLRFPGGTEAAGYFSFVAERAHWTEFACERGNLRVDRHGSRLELRVSRRFSYGVRRQTVAPSPEVRRLSWVRALRPSFDPSCRNALTDFVSAARGSPLGGATLEDGLRALEICLAIEEGAR